MANRIHQKAVAEIESTDDDKFGPNGGFTAVLSTPSEDRDGDRLFRHEWLDLPEWLPLDVDHGMSMADTIGKFHPYWDDDRLLMDAYFLSTEKAQTTRTQLNDLKDEASGTWPVGVSVAFLTDKSRKDGEPRRELLNAGVVAIPSNRDAVILASKEYLLEEGDKLRPLRRLLDQKDVTQAELIAALREFLDDLDEDTPDEPALAQGHWCMGTECCEEPDEAVALQSVDNAETKAPSGTGDGPALTQAIHDASVHLGAMCYPIAPDGEDTGATDGANKNVDEDPVEEKSPDLDLEAIKPEGLTMEQFKSALTEMLTPKSPEEPAPAEEAAAAPSAEDWARKAHALKMRVRTRL